MIDENEWKKEDRELAWKAVSVEHPIQDEWLDLRKVTYAFPDGTSFGPYYNYSRRNYVVILASDEDGNFLCVRQYRHGIREVTTEFPAGGIEKKIDDPRSPEALETALAAAERELREETGYVSDDWSPLLAVPSGATIADNWAYLFRAKNCRKAGDLQLDDTEFLIRKVLSPADIDALIEKGRFQQAVHCMGWFHIERGKR